MNMKLINVTASHYRVLILLLKSCLSRYRKQFRSFVLKIVSFKKFICFDSQHPAANWSLSLCQRYAQVHGIRKVQLKHGTKSLQNVAIYFMSNNLRRIYLF